jgi:Protein of unknown function (DUF1612)/HTH DNA binding domain
MFSNMLPHVDQKDSLPWRTLSEPLAKAEDNLARLDERLATSPIRDGFIARAHLADSCASVSLDGELVSLEDLVLHDANMDVCTPTPALARSHSVLRLRRRIAGRDPEWALSPAGLSMLMGRAGQGTLEEDRGERASGSTLGREALAAAEERALAEALAAVDAALDRSTRTLAGEPSLPQILSEGDETDNESRLKRWLGYTATTRDLPPTLAAALALAAWDSFETLPQMPWLGRLLVAALLRERGKTKTHLPALNAGLRAVPRERRRARDANVRLIAHIEAIALAGASGLAAHDRWVSARDGFRRKLRDRRSTSKLPDLIEYVIAHPVVSAAMIAKDLRISPRAAQTLVAELGIREITGRTRYRAWGVI